MTNVLIGIIGIVLFIGLALAGAYLLGPRFQQAYLSSKAMGMTQSSSQITAAISMHRGTVGVAVPAREPVLDLKDEGYLSALPPNPYVGEGGFPFRVLYSHDVESDQYYADVVFASIGHAGDAQGVCSSVQRESSGSDEIPVMQIDDGNDISGMIVRESGCFQVHQAGIYGEANPGDYVVYQRL